MLNTIALKLTSKPKAENRYQQSNDNLINHNWLLSNKINKNIHNGCANKRHRFVINDMPIWSQQLKFKFFFVRWFSKIIFSRLQHMQMEFFFEELTDTLNIKLSLVRLCLNWLQVHYIFYCELCICVREKREKKNSVTSRKFVYLSPVFYCICLMIFGWDSIELTTK